MTTHVDPEEEPVSLSPEEAIPLPQEETKHEVARRSPEEVKPLVEALLFATDQPLPIKRLVEILGAEKECLLRAIESLQQEYESSHRAFQVEEIAGGYQLLSKPEYHQWICLLEKKNTESKLSPAAMETLAIIAYKQPILRSTIEAIRGVESSQILRSLIEKGLVKIVGKDESLGRPLLYGTTKRFLDYFGLNSLNDLPRTQELSS